MMVWRVWYKDILESNGAGHSLAGPASPSLSDRWSHTKALFCLVNLEMEYHFPNTFASFIMSLQLKKKSKQQKTTTNKNKEKISNYLRYIVSNKYSREPCSQCSLAMELVVKRKNGKWNSSKWKMLIERNKFVFFHKTVDSCLIIHNLDSPKYCYIQSWEIWFCILTALDF